MHLTNMSATNNPSKVREIPADLHEDEVLMTWLQYPIDDGFERNYCADLFGEWPPRSAGEAAKAHPDVNMPLGTSLDMGINPCAGSGSSKLSTKKVGSKSLTTPAFNVEDALALGAHRAAGLSSQVGQEAFNKVRTSMQPQAISQRSTPSSSLKPSIDKSRPVKLHLPVASVPYACCKPVDSGVLVSPNSSRLYMCTSLSTEKNTHAPPSESFTIASKRSRKDYETHSELSHTRQSGLSRITEDNTIKRGKMIGRNRKFKINPMSWSEGSQTSMSLSFREATYSDKHKLDDSEFLSEDADVESTDTRKPCKSSSRRNRVAEVHNLSERNRRNRINEKLKALQDLIPNSSKTDKASMLDEAIEYTKTLQMQLQMVSMRSGMNMSPMMTPMALPQTHMHMMPLHSVGLGVPIGHAGMGMGMDMGYPVNVPQYSTASPFQAAPASMSQYGVPFQSGSTTGIQDCNQVFAHMGFLPSQSLPPSDPMHPMSPSTPQMKQCQRQEQVQDLGHSSLNHCKHEAHVREQEGISDEKDWKRM